MTAPARPVPGLVGEEWACVLSSAGTYQWRNERGNGRRHVQLERCYEGGRVIGWQVKHANSTWTDSIRHLTAAPMPFEAALDVATDYMTCDRPHRFEAR